MNESQLTQLVSLFDTNNIDIDISYFLKNDLDDLNNFDDIQNYLNNQGAFSVEIIYYGTAMDFLKENDSSLCESLEIAYEYGFSLENLNSETLASILASRILEQSFYGLEDNINEILNA